MSHSASSLQVADHLVTACADANRRAVNYLLGLQKQAG
jgi:hypothetical protein